MMGRITLGILSAVAAYASWSGRPSVTDAGDRVPVQVRVASRSVFADVLPPSNPMIPALDATYRDLEDALRPHGCIGCHAPELADERRAVVRRAVQVLDMRRSIEAMVEANLMPPETDDHPAGIGDDVERAHLLRKARAFRAIGDAALATW